VKVVTFRVAGFIALLNVAVTIVLRQAPLAPPKGATVVTVGGVRVGFPPVLSGSLHPIVVIRSRNAMKQIVRVLYLRMAVTLLVQRS
jgi:hypothetical protein